VTVKRTETQQWEVSVEELQFSFVSDSVIRTWAHDELYFEQFLNNIKEYLRSRFGKNKYIPIQHKLVDYCGGE
jgi:hypothetical protein